MKSVTDYWDKYGLSPPTGKAIERLDTLFDPRKKKNPLEGIPHIVMADLMQFLNNVDNRDLRGPLFEIMIEALFLHNDLVPYTRQAKLSLVPASNIDFLFIARTPKKLHKHTIIAISAKMSLAERWRQFQFEAAGLKDTYGHHNRFYAVGGDAPTKTKDGAKEMQKFEANRVYQAPSVDEGIVCTSQRFTNMFRELQAVKTELVKEMEIPFFIP